MHEIGAVRANEMDVQGTYPQSARTAPPWLFALLIAPSAVLMNGVVQGPMLAYFLRQHGVGIGRIGAIISTVSLPTSIYFLWSPVTDFLVQRRTWLLMGAVAAGVLMGASFLLPDMASRLAVMVMFVAASCSQLVVASCGGMMGTLGEGRPRALASSFYQAGSAGFGALSAFVLIKVADHNGWFTRAASLVGDWQRLLVLVLLILIAAPGLIALAVPRGQVGGGESLGSKLHNLGHEFKATFWRWGAIPYAVLLVFPMNSSAATSLLAGVARDYGVSGDQVAWMNGLAGALLVAGGSLAATLIPSRVRASVSYLIVGLANAATLLVLWLCPMRPGVYFVGVALYLFTTGTGLATFTAVVLEFLGDSGSSGSGRYSIINSLGNVPVLYMIALDGRGGGRWGARGVSATDAVVSTVGAVLLLAYFLTKKKDAVQASGVAR